MAWRRMLPLVALLVLLPLYGLLHEMSWQQRAEVRRSAPAGYRLPPELSRVLALGYHGLLSDYEFLRAMTFYGGRSVERQAMSAADWDFLVQLLQTTTQLDPYFLDPYVLAEGLLTWEAQRFEQANTLLERGMHHRQWDWQLPFYIGFNHFYFLKDYAAGAEYVMQAAARPGSPAYLTTLAARLAYYGGQSQTALLFLQQMLAESHSAALRQQMARRLLALQQAVTIEQALARYRVEQGGDPPQLQELVSRGYLPELPPDPYGGQWRLLENGRVYSSSRFVDSK